MHDNKEKLQVADSMGNIDSLLCLTRNDKKGYLMHVTAKKKAEPLNMKNVRLVPTQEENAILEAAMKKHGLKKAVDVVRMALRRFAELEDLKLAS